MNKTNTILEFEQEEVDFLIKVKELSSLSSNCTFLGKNSPTNSILVW